MTTPTTRYHAKRSLELIYRDTDGEHMIAVLNLDTADILRTKIEGNMLGFMSNIFRSAGLHENLYESLNKGYYEGGEQGSQDCPRVTQTGRCDERFRKGPRTGSFYDERGRGTIQQPQETTSAGEKINLDRSLLSNVLTR